jgi:hypothetical protein
MPDKPGTPHNTPDQPTRRINMPPRRKTTRAQTDRRRSSGRGTSVRGTGHSTVRGTKRRLFDGKADESLREHKPAKIEVNPLKTPQIEPDQKLTTAMSDDDTSAPALDDTSAPALDDDTSAPVSRPASRGVAPAESDELKGGSGALPV